RRYTVVVMSISAADLIAYKGRYSELISKADCPETRAVVAALAYGSLDDIPAERLKQLPQEVHDYLARVSLVHAVTTLGRTLEYDTLLRLLRLPSDAALESLVVDAVYEGVCTATMDGSARTVTVSSWAARETDPAVIGGMVDVLGQWMERSDGVIASATAKAAEEDEKLAAMREHERVVKDELTAARVAMEEEFKEYKGGRGGAGGAGGSRGATAGSSSEMLAPLGANNGRNRSSRGIRGGRTGK
ncbi:hypothetical protein PRIPAC_83084, partial [Pristionchus pacificus]